jgi:uncharacterized repeat protein (TIGR02543 family)
MGLSTTVYAKWTENDYTISFNSNGGSAVTAITQEFGTTVSAPTPPTKTGNTFVGWYSDIGLTTAYTFTTMPASNITLYAKWTVNDYTISFVSNGGSAVTAITQAYGSTVSAPTAPTKTGNTFAGWYSDVGLTTAYTFTTMPASNTTLYAKWTVNDYTISFVSNGGSPVTAITQAYGSTVTAPTPPTKTGNTFAGWYSDIGLTTAYTFTTMPAVNITLYAKWTVNSYTLTYTAGANGSITGDSPQTVNYGGSGTAVSAVAATGYHFVNWSDLSTTNPRTETNVTANISVTANFALNNNAPVITEGASVDVSMSQDGSPMPFNLTLNAADADSDTITWSILTPAGHGTASAGGTGISKAITYTPILHYIGSDTFIVQVSDGKGGTDTIIVNVTITAVAPTTFTITLPLILR